ncbi:MAG TPA: YHS domain-containing protein [Candidatus Brocadiales bacterium]|nr:YHS domain-containing protein [Candidatus Brocadiales bacterium]
MNVQKILLMVTCAVFFLLYPAVMVGEEVFDPVCGKKVDRNEAVQAEYDGKIYCFCSENCFARFEKAPDNFACSCPSGSKDCAHCQGTAARCPCDIEKHTKGHEGHDHHPEHGH